MLNWKLSVGKVTIGFRYLQRKWVAFFFFFWSGEKKIETHDHDIAIKSYYIISLSLGDKKKIKLLLAYLLSFVWIAYNSHVVVFNNVPTTPMCTYAYTVFMSYYDFSISMCSTKIGTTTKK